MIYQLEADGDIAGVYSSYESALNKLLDLASTHDRVVLQRIPQTEPVRITIADQHVETMPTQMGVFTH